MTILDVAHLWQDAPTAPNKNDCAQACVGKYLHTFTDLRPTVGQIATSTGTAHNSFVSITDLLKMGTHKNEKTGLAWDMGLWWTGNATIDWYRKMLDEGCPVIALVHYGKFTNRPNNYALAHFLMVIGYDETGFWLNDPLQKNCCWKVSNADFKAAIDTPSPGNSYGNLAVYPKELRVNMTGGGFNLDVLHPVGAPKVELLAGTKFARIVYKVSQAAGGHGNLNLDHAYQVYAPYLQSLIKAGITPILVLNHETFGEGQDEFKWNQMTDNDWRNRYIPKSTDFDERVAAQFRGWGITYQKWNQQDIPKDPTPEDSIPLSPQIFGELYRASRARIKATDPTAKVITGGFVRGAGDAVAYFKAANIPPTECDGAGAHPYGTRWLNDNTFPTYHLIENYLAIWKAAYPQLPLYITECGHQTPEGLPRENIGKVITHSTGLVKATQGKVVAILHYAVADGMHTSNGALDKNGKLKVDAQGRNLLDVFKGSGTVTTPPPPTDVKTFYLFNASELRARAQPSVSANILGVLKTGTKIKQVFETKWIEPYVWFNLEAEINSVYRGCWAAVWTAKDEWRCQIR